MAKTAFNPITTKWSGKVGAFTYRIRRGKQIIATNGTMPKGSTEAQVKTRARFKLGSQFSSLWFESIVRSFLRPSIADKTEARGRLTAVVFRNATTTTMIDEDGPRIYANANILDIANDLNNTYHRLDKMGELSITGDEQTPSTVIFQPDENLTGILQVAYFGKNGVILGKEITPLNEDGTATTIDIPSNIDEIPLIRADAMALPFKINSESEWGRRYSDYLGVEPGSSSAAKEIYSLFLESVASEVLTPQALSAISMIVA